MEPVSLALSAAALLSTVLDTFSLISSVRSVPESSTTLFRQLELERAVLLNWGADVGLSPKEDCQTRCIIDASLIPLVHDTIAAIGSLLSRATSSETKFRLAFKEPRVLRETSKEVEDDIARLQRRSASFPANVKRFAWAASDEPKLKDIVNSIHAYNQSLHHLVPKPMRVRLEGSLLQGLLAASSSTDSLYQMEEISRELRPEVSTAAGILRRNQSGVPGTVPLTSDLMLQRSGFFEIGKDLTRRVTSYQGQSGQAEETTTVLMEWRLCTIVDKQRFLDNCLELARLLHASQNTSEYRTLDCLGIFQDVEFTRGQRVALVYRVPPSPSNQPSLEVHRLYDLINGSKEFGRPKLGQRFELASALSIGLHRLLVSRWFHKSLNSKNILFFLPATGPISIDLHIVNPYIAGFDYARPNAPNQDTIKPDEDEFADRYRHPDCTNSDTRATIPYSRRFDIYSLGVLLIEIGHWETVDKMHESFKRRRMKEQPRVPPPSLVDFQAYLASVCVNSLGFRMGQVYTEAVRFCLSNGHHAEDELVSLLNSKVVSDIAKCRA